MYPVAAPNVGLPTAVAPPVQPVTPMVSQPVKVQDARVDLGRRDQASTPTYDRLQEVMNSELRLSFARLIELSTGGTA